MLSVGPNSPGNVASVSRDTGADWDNPENAKIQNNTYAAASLSSSVRRSDWLHSTAFDFGASIPDSAIIRGILVEIDRCCTKSLTTDRDSPRLIGPDGTYIGTAKTTGSEWATSDTDTYEQYGGSSDLWGTAGLTGADINTVNFGVALQAYYWDASSSIAKVDHPRMTVYYDPPTDKIGAPIPARLPARLPRILTTRLPEY